MIELDGSHGEGGGQILRLAVVASQWTGQPFHMIRIRANRPDPGLKPQHLHVLKAAADFCNARVAGAEKRSPEVTYEPGECRGGNLSVDIGTAGSITLFLQTFLPLAITARRPSHIRVVGGTDVKASPPLDYVRELLLPPGASLVCKRRGFYPKGGGEVDVAVKPEPLPPLDRVRRGDARHVRILSVSTPGLRDRRVAERQSQAAADVLLQAGLIPKMSNHYEEAYSDGSVTTILADGVGADALGERGKRAEVVGAEAAQKLVAELASGAPVDSHAADNLIPWLFHAGGELLASSITGHTRTAVWLFEQFAGPWCRIEGTTLKRTD